MAHCHHDGNCGSSHEETTTGEEQWTLYRYVDFDKATCLNELESNSLRNVLRPFHLRYDTSLPVLTSAVDEQLLLWIPFTQVVKLKAIAVIGGGGGTSPSQVELFINNEQLVDFSLIQGAKALQTIQLAPPTTTSNNEWVEYPTKYTKFQNVQSLIMFFPSNFGAERTVIQYIGLKGQATNYRREAVETVYEARPMSRGTSTGEDWRNFRAVE
jgi:hypothetical protein